MSKSEFGFKLESHLPEAKAALEKALLMWAEMTGGEMENLTHRDEAQGGTPVDTGRLRNSITFAHSGHQGFTHSYEDDDHNPYSDAIGSGAKPRTVYIGTNVEYAEPVEDGALGKSGAHMLRNAVTDVGKASKKYLKEALEAQNLE